MLSTQPVSAVPNRKSISRTDVQALGLILMILVVIDLPLYRSATKDSEKQVSTPVVAIRKAPVKTFSIMAFANRFKTGVSRPTTTSGASNSNMAR